MLIISKQEVQAKNHESILASSSPSLSLELQIAEFQ